MKTGTVEKALGMIGASEAWWVERELGERLAGPFTTRDDAWRARDWVERALRPETFWLRNHPITGTE